MTPKNKNKALTFFASRILLSAVLISQGACAELGPGNILGLFSDPLGLFTQPVVGEIVLRESENGTFVSEGGGSDDYTVELSAQPVEVVHVDITFDETQVTVNGSGSSPLRMSFTPFNWNEPRTVSVRAVNDDLSEGTLQYVLSHTPTTTDVNYLGLSEKELVASVFDDDTAGIIVSKTGLTTYEGGPGDGYTVVLTSQPFAAVRVDVNFLTAQLRANGASVSPLNLNFTAANWNVPQAIVISAVDDVVNEGAHNSSITHAASSADLDYNGIAVGGLTTSISDNDVNLRIFATNTTTTGNLGGVTGADALCMADGNKPAGGTWKAMIVDGVNRRACASANCGVGGFTERIDWVFRPAQTYVRSGTSTVILTTNAIGIHDFAGGNIANSFVGSSVFYWTGLNSDWT